MATRIAAATGVFAALVASFALFAGPASAVVGGDEGGSGCPPAHGTSVTFDQTHLTTACLSDQTGFWAQQPGVNGPDSAQVCNLAGYEAQIYYVTQNFDYVPRYDEFWCPNGTWHFSTPWPAGNELRYSWMETWAPQMAWEMIEFQA